MRVIQLGFRLHQMKHEKAETDFRRAETEIYQPLFALLERNIQKQAGFHFTLMISGPWIELAEQYAPTLIERLQKMMKQGRAEIVAEPYYYSLAGFYDQAELAAQVDKYMEKVKRLFGVERRILAMPELIYNDEIAKWAEDAGFAGMLAGDASRILDWRSPNHVYEAADCQYLRVLFQNVEVTRMIERADAEVLTTKRNEDGKEREVFSIAKLRKQLDLEFLRGGLSNLYFDAKIIQQQRRRGVIGLFDELITTWLEGAQNKFATAAEACVVETPTTEVSVKETISCRGDGCTMRNEKLPVKLSDLEAKLPWWAAGCQQKTLGKMIYSLRRAVMASEDEKLIAEYRWLTQLDYQERADANLVVVQEKIQKLCEKIDEVKKQQAVEISRAYTKKRDRGDVSAARMSETEDDTTVKVHFGVKRTAGTSSRAVHAVDNSGVVPVHRVRVSGDRAIEVAEALQNAEDAEVVQSKPKKNPMQRVRKVIKKLVIE